MDKIIAAVVGLMIASPANAWGDAGSSTSMPLSISDAPTVMLVNSAPVETMRRDTPADWHMDEFAGAAMVGGYLLYRARRARII